jgi:hypothetical protein
MNGPPGTEFVSYVMTFVVVEIAILSFPLEKQAGVA